MTETPRLARAIFSTWPAVEETVVGPFVVPLGGGGGNRVSAARLKTIEGDGSAITPAQVAEAAEVQREFGQEPLFMVFGWQAALDDTLAQGGYEVRDATDMLWSASAHIAVPPPAVTCFDVWPPLAVEEDIWAEGGIGPARLAIMHRVKGPRTSLFGRTQDKPAGAGFVAIDGEVAMLHALEVAPRSRRQGLARTMVHAAAHWAETNGAYQFTVLVTEANIAAQSLYSALGLAKVGGYHYRVKPKAKA